MFSVMMMMTVINDMVIMVMIMINLIRTDNDNNK